jgi:hypothetical protein
VRAPRKTCLSVTHLAWAALELNLGHRHVLAYNVLFQFRDNGPRGPSRLTRRSAGARVLGLRVRIPRGVEGDMDVYCQAEVSENELISSSRRGLLCVVVCDIENLKAVGRVVPQQHSGGNCKHVPKLRQKVLPTSSMQNLRSKVGKLLHRPTLHTSHTLHLVKISSNHKDHVIYLCAHSVHNINSYELVTGTDQYHVILMLQHCNVMPISFMYFRI